MNETTPFTTRRGGWCHVRWGRFFRVLLAISPVFLLPGTDAGLALCHASDEASDNRPHRGTVILRMDVFRDAQMESLGGMTRLRDLHVDFKGYLIEAVGLEDQATDAGLSNLQELRGLRRLTLSNSRKISDAGLKASGKGVRNRFHRLSLDSVPDSLRGR